MDFPTRKITLYHKSGTAWVRYLLIASYRGTSIVNRNKTGVSTADSVLIRIFEKDNGIYEIAKGDVVVNKNVEDEITGTTPLTTLQNLYGKDNVFTIKSIDDNRYEDSEIAELNHIKIGLV